MSLAHLLPLFTDITLPELDRSVGAVRWMTDALSASARAAAIAALAERTRRPILVLVSRQEVADTLVANLGQLLPLNAAPLVWSVADPLPYEQMPHDPGLSAQRSVVLGKLSDSAGAAHPPVVVATARALMTSIRAPQTFGRDIIHLAVGDRIDDAGLVRRLVGAGYVHEPQVEGPGTLSRRGGILDIFTPGSNDAVRIELFGDEIDSIRRFDPLTQRSTERISQVTILPPIEYDLSDKASALDRLAQLDRTPLREEVNDEWERLIALLDAEAIPPSIDLLASFFPHNDLSLLDYLPRESVVITLDVQAIRLQFEQVDLQAGEVRNALELAGEIPVDLPVPYQRGENLRESIARFPVWEIGGADEDAALVPTGASFSDPPLFGGRIDLLIEQLRRELANGQRIVLATEQSERLRELLDEAGMYPRTFKRGAGGASTPPAPGTIDVIHAALTLGFRYEPAKLLVLSDLELFGTRKLVRAQARPVARKPRHVRQFRPGAYVVHVEHGVGTFSGLVRLDLSGVEREYLQVDYAGGDRLYVPVDQSDRLTPYESPAGEPRITRLSSAEWAKTTSRVRRAVREMAWELLQLYAAREAAEGHQFPPDSVWDAELSDSFPFRETPEQDKAIQDVKGDMESLRPMDRLVCGDVGYGKTEVALRAAFKAVNDGMQVAILVPTTILALQHFNTFRERLAAFPVRVEMLSRLRSKAEQAQIVRGVADGSVDIVIGTHRLLQKDVEFKNLGLLVVDEEQRFGVRHKEHVKRMRSSVDVLTMTATPIPRTLHLALSGLRDLSLITTPPRDRVPIRTFVTAADDSIIREAILREVARGGQVYVVHNRVQSIYRLCERLQELIPEASFGVAHGQMEERELERMVLAFIRQEFDVLICTTIIESGVDIPNANTIILDNAHALGLTQMYQLRGRVGRSTNRAYAYVLYPPNTPLSVEALERLEAIQEATELGAGFQVAMRDMEIRGAGNILGGEQSGHIAAVGFDLYTRMLAHAVEEIRAGHPIAEPEEVSLDIAVEAGIPDSYVADEQGRLDLYQRIAAAKNERGLIDLNAELRDRFGPVPESTELLFDLVRLRQRASRLGLTTIVERDGDILIRPVFGGKLSQQHLRRELGNGVRVTPNQIRLRVDDVRLPRLSALNYVLDVIAQRRASMAAQDSEGSEESSSASSDNIVRARSA
ncbi:MAG: transcription-repair coupling factor [Thermomicrobiales bacterium]|nr:transcription-repair coupling factor [Thermomicrobiales bacterium]